MLPRKIALKILYHCSLHFVFIHPQHFLTILPLLPPANEVAGRQCFHSCLSFCSGEGGDHYPSCIETWAPVLLTSGGHHWIPVQTCSHEDLTPPYHQQWYLLVATETCTVGKRMGGILLECCLVFRWFKFTLKPPYSITHDKLWLAIWDTSFWTFLVKFGHKGPWDIS